MKLGLDLEGYVYSYEVTRQGLESLKQDTLVEIGVSPP